MKFTRRQFIKAGVAMSTASAFPSIWWRVGEAAAALEPCETGVNLVIVHLEGGNDGINMVIPKSGANRTVYDTVRLPGGLNIPAANLAATQIGNDPLHNGELALHPHMTGLKALYDSQNLAVLCGVHYPNANLSHDVSSSIWYRADPTLVGSGNGWIGRTLDSLCSASTNAVPAVDTSGQLTPLFYGNTSVFAFDSLSDLVFPVSDAIKDAGLTAAYRGRFANIYGNAADNGTNFLRTIGAVGSTAAEKLDLYHSANEGLAGNLNGLINGTGNVSFGVAGVRQSYSLARKLRTVFALMKGSQPGNNALGCRVFRVNIGGFDTHSDQGGYTAGAITTKLQNSFRGEYHGWLMHRIDRSLSAFWADVQGDPALSGTTILMTFSEFGRRVEENGDHDDNSGTDHGTAAPQFVIGPKAGESAIAAHLVGGVYGGYPELDHLDANGNMVHQLDFRHIYGEVINRWLGLNAATTQGILGGYNYLTDPNSADFLV